MLRFRFPRATGPVVGPTAEEAPLRAELYTAEQMVQHGTSLAATHQIASKRGPERLRARLADNGKTLRTICARLARSVSASGRVTPGAEWLLDNFYLIEEEIGTATRHLPPATAASCRVCALGRALGSRVSTTSPLRRWRTATGV